MSYIFFSMIAKPLFANVSPEIKRARQGERALWVPGNECSSHNQTTLHENLNPALKAWKNSYIHRSDSYAKMSKCPPDLEGTVYLSLPIQLIF